MELQTNPKTNCGIFERFFHPNGRNNRVDPLILDCFIEWPKAAKRLIPAFLAGSSATFFSFPFFELFAPESEYCAL